MTPRRSVLCWIRWPTRSPRCWVTGPMIGTAFTSPCRHANPEAVVVPPRLDAALSDSAETAPTQRDRHLQQIAQTGRLSWQRDSVQFARPGGGSDRALQTAARRRAAL